MEETDKEKYEKYFFENSESLKKFVLIVYISSLINLYLYVVSPPGLGKTTAIRAISEIRGRLLNQKIPFHIHPHHLTTQPKDFYGSTTILDSEVVFKEGSLTLAINEGSVYIADNFNISSELNMKSVTPVLERTFNQDLIIPGIEGITSIDPNFFFIICQNDAWTFGRHVLPEKIKTKLRKLIYPEQTKEEIESICSDINNSLYDEGQKNKLEDIETRYCGDYMIMLNMQGLTPNFWSFRDISKILMRMKNQKQNNENFKGIGTAVNLLYYSLSSIPQRHLDDEIVYGLIEILKTIFKGKVDEEDLNKIIYDEPKLIDKYNCENQKRVYYIQKHNSQIYFDTIDLREKRSEEVNKKK